MANEFTGLKVKLVFSGTVEDADNAMKPIKEHYNKYPIKLTFGVNENTTKQQIQKDLNSIINSQIEIPKIKLSTTVDTSNLSKQLAAALEKITVDGGNVSGSKGNKFTADFLSDQIDVYIKRLQSYEASAPSLNGSEAYIDKLKTNIGDLNDAQESKDLDQMAQALSKVTGEMKLLTAERQRLSAETRQTRSNISNTTNLNSLKNEVDAYIESLKKIKVDPETLKKFQEFSNSILSSGDSVTKLRGDFYKLQYEAREAGKTTETLNNKLLRLFGEHWNTALIMAGVHAIQNAAQQIIINVSEIDAAMTELKKVTNETSQTYIDFLDKAETRAKSLGSTISNVVTATADFARLGYSLDEATSLADSAVIYKNVGDGIENITDASESIISTMKAFNIEAENSIAIVDKFNEVGNNYAISSRGVGEALQRSAAALAQAGNSLDESIGLIVAGNAVVQDPEVVGTALKTLTLRLTKTKTELEQMGESGDYAATSISELRDQIKAYTAAAGQEVDIMDGDSYKSTYDILVEISKVWDKLNNQDQQAILYMLGGARQANVVSSIISNIEDAQSAAETAMNSTGSAVAENEKYLDSIAGKAAQFQAAFQGLSTTLIDSGFIKWVIDLGTGAVETTNYLTELVGVFPALTTAISGILTLSNKDAGLFTLINPASYKELKNGYIDFIKYTNKLNSTFSDSTPLKSGITDYIKYLISAKSHTMALAAKQVALKATVTALNMAFTLFASYAVNLAVTGIISLVNAEKEQIETARDATTEYNNRQKSLEDHIDRINELKIALENETQTSEESTRAKEELASIQQTLVDTYGLEASKLDLVNGKLKDQLDLLNEISVADANKTLNENISAYKTAEDEMAKERDFVLGTISDSDAEMIDLAKQFADSGIKLNNIGDVDGKAVYEITLTANSTDAENIINEFSNAIRAKFGSDSEYLTSILSDALNSAKEINDSFADMNNTYQLLKIVTDTKNGYQDLYDTIGQRQAELSEAIAAGDKDRIDEIRKEISDGGDLFDQVGDISDDGLRIFFTNLLNGMIELANTSEDTSNAVKNSVNNIVESLDVETVNDQLKNLESTYKTLTTAVDEYNETGYFSIDTLQSLLSMGGDYLQYLQFENGQVSINQQALNMLAQSRLNDAKAKVYEQAIDIIKTFNDEAVAAEYLSGSLDDLAESRLKNAQAGFLESYSYMMSKGTDTQKKATAELTENVYSVISALDNQFAAIQSGSGAALGAASSSSKYTSALEEEKKALEAEKDALENSKDALEKKKDTYDSALSAINKLIDDEIDRLNELGQAEKEALEGQLDDLDKAHSAAIQIIDDQISKLEEQKDALDDYYQPMIDAIQDQIDALEEKNDQEERALALQKAQDAYERAKTQKTIRLYTHDKGFIWAADEDTIQEAQENLDQAQHDKEVADLEDQKKELEEALEAEKEKLQESIDAYEEYKKKWEEITSEYENAQNKQILIMLFGKEIEQQIIDQKGEAYEAFRDRYLAVQEQLTDLEAEIAANQERIEQLEQIKKAWADAADAYENEQNRLHAAQILGADWEKQILDGRVSTLNTFKDQYYKLQVDIANIADQIAAKTEEISRKAAEIEAAAQRAASAAASVGANIEKPPQFTIYGLDGTIRGYADSESQAKSMTRNGTTYYVKNYARGTRNAPGGLSNVDEIGPELIVRPRQGRFTILDPGDGVIPADMTNTLFKAATNPSQFMINQFSTIFRAFRGSKLASPQNDMPSLSIGDIYLSGVQDVNSLSDAIINKFPNIMLQKIKKR